MTETPASPKPDSSNTLVTTVSPGEDVEVATARTVIGPDVASADIIRRFTSRTFGDHSLMALVTALREGCARVNAGDLREVEAMLFAQATALNGLFADLTRRAAANLGDGHTFDAGETLLKMAMKAQSQCRATLETLATVKNPPVFARQANIANGPQQVNNTLTAPSHAGENPKAPNELLEASHEQPLDAGTPGAAGKGNSSMETVDTLHRTPKRRR